MASPIGDIKRHVYEISLFFEVADMRRNNSHEAIARSYCDETLPNSRRQTVSCKRIRPIALYANLGSGAWVSEEDCLGVGLPLRQG